MNNKFILIFSTDYSIISISMCSLHFLSLFTVFHSIEVIRVHTSCEFMSFAFELLQLLDCFLPLCMESTDNHRKQSQHPCLQVQNFSYLAKDQKYPIFSVIKINEALVTWIIVLSLASKLLFLLFLHSDRSPFSLLMPPIIVIKLSNLLGFLSVPPILIPCFIRSIPRALLVLN